MNKEIKEIKKEKEATCSRCQQTTGKNQPYCPPCLKNKQEREEWKETVLLRDKIISDLATKLGSLDKPWIDSYWAEAKWKEKQTNYEH